ncbi:MAG: hypothetical protein OQK98_00995 [Gammaproteobacteria bacterium]|nr:hypothetical protein [Gammaproteobacteria bacterium]
MNNKLIVTLPVTLLCSFMLYSCGSSVDSTDTTNSTAALAGNWSFHSLRSGVSPRWRYGNDQIDANGNATRINITRSSNNQDIGEAYTLSVDTNNTILKSGVDTYHGTLSNDDLIVNTRSRNSGSAYRLQFLQKQSDNYSLSDLQGDWHFHTLSSGSTNDWRHGEEQIDASGNVTRVSVVNSDNSVIVGGDYTLGIDAQGNITRTDVASYHGSISDDKTLMINTRSKESGTTFRIKILQKKGGSFTTADLAGTWVFHNLVSGAGASWTYGVDTIDANGIVINTSRFNNSGDTTTRAGIQTLTLDANGVIRRSDSPSYHGVMSADKNYMIVTTDAGAGAYRLKVFQRRN